MLFEGMPEDRRSVGRRSDAGGQRPYASPRTLIPYKLLDVFWNGSSCPRRKTKTDAFDALFSRSIMCRRKMHVYSFLCA
jgi:hypothetical protein